MARLLYRDHFFSARTSNIIGRRSGTVKNYAQIGLQTPAE